MFLSIHFLLKFLFYYYLNLILFLLDESKMPCKMSKVFFLFSISRLKHSLHHRQGDSLRTNIQLDFGDGIAVSYSNLSWTEEGIRHVYRNTGIFRVTAVAENSLGSDTDVLYLHIICKLLTCWYKADCISVNGDAHSGLHLTDQEKDRETPRETRRGGEA